MSTAVHTLLVVLLAISLMGAASVHSMHNKQILITSRVKLSPATSTTIEHTCLCYLLFTELLLSLPYQNILLISSVCVVVMESLSYSRLISSSTLLDHIIILFTPANVYVKLNSIFLNLIFS